MAKSQKVDYESLLQKALRQVVRDILQEVAHHGLQGDQHFYFTFATNHPWVDLPSYLKEAHPVEMVIALKNDFEDLEVRSDSFSVTLYFEDEHGDEREERITVPFMALVNFVDPSANFGLQFIDVDEDFEDGTRPVERTSEQEEASSSVPNVPDPNVISLDDFRKK